MDYLSYNISVNLRRIRKNRGMSLDETSEQTGVSKSMLHRIEHGNGSVSINVVGRIASGLRVDLNSLLGPPPEESLLIRAEELYPIKEAEGQYAVRTCFPYEDSHKLEIYRIDVEPGGRYVSGGHGDGTKEYLVMLEGEITIDTGHEIKSVKKDDLLRFNSENTHIYSNEGTERAVVFCFFVV
ncbi:MAG: XRE family transcriptional regulator [Clostridiales bacterium]|nr:XRE family transcriptional regulator [Clostridiales bacterium]